MIWLALVGVATTLRLLLYYRFFRTHIGHHPEHYWLFHHAWTAGLVGLAWGAVAAIPVPSNVSHIHELQTLIPGFILMATISSYGVYFSQYLVLWSTTGAATIIARLYASGMDGAAEVALFALFLPVLLLTAKRYGQSISASIAARHRSEQLVDEITVANNKLQHHNAVLARQRDVMEHEEALAKHVFQQLTVGGDHSLEGVHSWNQPMGSLSGDLVQTVRGPSGQSYVFLGDFTGHGLPAALGALPASSVFLAMAAKGLPVSKIAAELNRKLRQLLPVGYFCCAVLVELSPDRRRIDVWNGGLPPILIRRKGKSDYERVESHSLPLGVAEGPEFDSASRQCTLNPGDRLYIYTDGLTEAENIEGEFWGTERLESFLTRDDLPPLKLPALIEAVLEFVNLAPASDDITVVEIEATPSSADEYDAQQEAPGELLRAGLAAGS